MFYYICKELLICFFTLGLCGYEALGVVMGTTTQGVLEVLISLKNDTLLKAEYRDGMYDLEEELGRKKWNLNASYDSKFYLCTSMRK